MAMSSVCRSTYFLESIYFLRRSPVFVKGHRGIFFFFLTVFLQLRHGLRGGPEALHGTVEPQKNSGENDPNAPIVASVQPNCQPDKAYGRHCHRKPQLRQPDQILQTFHLRLPKLPFYIFRFIIPQKSVPCKPKIPKSHLW